MGYAYFAAKTFTNTDDHAVDKPPLVQHQHEAAQHHGGAPDVNVTFSKLATVLHCSSGLQMNSNAFSQRFTKPRNFN